MFGDCYNRLVCAGDCFTKRIEAEGEADTDVCNLKGRCYYTYLGHLGVVRGSWRGNVRVVLGESSGHDLEDIEVSGAE